MTSNKPQASANNEVTDLQIPQVHRQSFAQYLKNIINYLNALRQAKNGLIGKFTVLRHATAMLMSEVDKSGQNEEKQLIIRSTIIKTNVQDLVKSKRLEYKAIHAQKRDL